MALDGEFVKIEDGTRTKRGGFRGKNRIGHLAIVTIEDGLRKVLFKKMIRPRLTDGQTINCCTRYSGITRADLHSGVPYDDVIDEVKELLKGAIVVGHNVRSDFDALELSTEDAGLLCVHDTAMNADLNALVSSEADKPQSKLCVLAQCLLDRAIQCQDVHDPEEDAFASLDLFLKYRHLFEESPGVPKQRHLPPSNPRGADRATLMDGSERTFYLQ